MLQQSENFFLLMPASIYKRSVTKTGTKLFRLQPSRKPILTNGWRC